MKKKDKKNLSDLFWSLFIIASFIGMGMWNIVLTSRNSPEKTYWQFLPSGRFTTRADFFNNRFVITDVYGKEVAEFVLRRNYDRTN